MEEIDLKDILLIIKKRWWMPTAGALLFALAGIIISFFVLTPVYQASTTLYIGKNLDETTKIEYTDIVLGTQLVKDYRELVKSRLVSQKVLDNLNLGTMTVDQLSAKVGVELKNDTRVFQITANDINPVLATDIANQVAVEFQEAVMQIMQVENVTIIDTATVPQAPIKPDKKMYVAIAFILGLMLGVGIAFLLEYLDNTIKTPEDIKKYLDLPVIGTIPDFLE